MRNELVNSEQAHQEMLKEEVRSEIRNFGGYPVNTMSNEKPESVIDREDWVNTKKRFFVVEVAHPEHRIIVYKKSLNTTPAHRQDLNNEMSFYTSAGPFIRSKIDPEIDDAIGLPKVLKTDLESERPYAFIEYMDGEPGGSLYELDTDQISSGDLESVFAFIKAVQSISPDERTEHFPQFSHTDRSVYFSLEKNRDRILSDRKDALLDILGEEYYNKLVAILAASEEYFKGKPEYLVNCDINPNNLIKEPNGKICIIDWERLKLVQSPASGFTRVLSSLVTNGERYNQAYQSILEINDDIPEFDTILKFDLVLLRFPGLSTALNYEKAKNPNIPPSEREHSLAFVTAMRDRFVQEIDNLIRLLNLN